MFRNTQRHMLRNPTSIALTAIVNLVTANGCVHITEPIGSRRELVANSCTHRRCRRDATWQFRRVGGVYWALGTAENHGNTEVMETVIFVKCCDFAKIPWFLRFYKKILFLISISWSVILTQNIYLCLWQSQCALLLTGSVCDHGIIVEVYRQAYMYSWVNNVALYAVHLVHINFT